MFNKQFEQIDKICDRELAHEVTLGPPEERPVERLMFKNLIRRNFHPIKLGQTREKLKEDALIEAAYEKDGDQM